MDGESLRTQGARFGRAGSFFVENVRKPENFSFGRLVINKILTIHDGIRVRFRSRSASFPPYVRSFSSPEFLCKMDNEIRGRQNVLFLPPVHKSLGSQ